MRLNLPLRLAAPGGLSAGTRRGTRLNLGNVAGGGLRLSPRDRGDQTLRAVAGATSLYDLKKAMETAQLAAEEPDKVIAPDISDEILAPVLKAVADAQDKPADAPKANKAQTATAKELGVSKELVAAAYAAIEDATTKADRDDRAEESREWVAAVNATLLSRAARAGARAGQLERVPTRATRLGRIEKQIRSLDKRVTALEERE